jgi:hypothetical protein
MAFIGPNQFFILEKASGQVKLVSNGAVTKTVLDLGVNNSSERGLLAHRSASEFSHQPRRIPLLDLPGFTSRSIRPILGTRRVALIIAEPLSA